MPLDIRHLQARQSDPISAHIKGEDQPLIFTFYPHKFTSDMQARLAAVKDTDGEEAKGLERVIRELDDLIIGWDLVSEGQPWPKNRENLSALGLPTLNALMTAMVAYVSGTNKEGESEDRKNSNGSSEPAVVKDAVPIGSP